MRWSTVRFEADRGCRRPRAQPILGSGEFQRREQVWSRRGRREWAPPSPAPHGGGPRTPGRAPRARPSSAGRALVPPGARPAAARGARRAQGVLALPIEGGETTPRTGLRAIRAPGGARSRRPHPIGDGRTMKRIGVLTGGGDVPGLNPCIKSLVYGATARGYEVVGIKRGWAGLLDFDLDADVSQDACAAPLIKNDVRTIDRTGGTFLHTSRTNPGKVRPKDVPAFLAGQGKGESEGTCGLTEL